MNIIQRLYSGVKAVLGTYTLQDAVFGKWLGGSHVSTSGVMVNDDSMMKLSVVWSCIRILSETIGSLPWALYKRDGSNSERDDKHPVAALLNAPNDRMTAVEFKEALIVQLCKRGNAYCKKAYVGASVVSLYPLSNDVRVKQEKDTQEIYYEVLEGGVWKRYSRNEIWHVKGFGDGYVGMSPIEAARDAIGLGLATDTFGSLFFSQGGKPAGIISMPGYLKKDQREIARESMNQMMSGLGNAHRFALFEGGMKPEPWGDMSLDDMQFILTRKFTIQELCRFYRVPPHMVADLDRATFSNIEHMSLEFVQFTLMPYFTRIESSISRWLLPVEDRAKYFVRFNFEGLLRADSSGRSAFYQSALQNGYMTRNEVRAKENLNASTEKGMDDFTVQVNLAPIDKLGEVVTAQKFGNVTPAPPAEPLEPPAKSVMGDTHNFNMVMPETIKHELKQRVEVPNIPELIRAVNSVADSARKTADQSSLSVAAVIAKVEQFTQKQEESVEELKKLAAADRVAIFDDKGNPIGTRVVH